MKTIILALVLALVTGPGCKSEKRDAAGPVASATPKFRIGVIAPLTGQWQDFGQSIERGARLAAAEVNKRGGLLGKQVELEIGDSTGDPDTANSLAHSFVTERQVKLLIGTATEDETLAVIEAATELKVPFIYTADGALKTCKPGQPKTVSGLVWSTGLTPDMAIEPLLIHLSETLRQVGSTFRFVYFGTRDPESSVLTEEFRTTVAGLGFENSESLAPDPRIDDFYDQIQSLFRLGADVLFVSVAQERLLLFMEQATKMSVRKDMSVTGLTAFAEENIRRLQAFGDGVVTVTRYLPGLGHSANRDFLTRWKSMYPAEEMLPTALSTAGSYTAVLIASKAFAKAGSDSLDLFQSAMNGLEFDLPQGKVIVDSKNHSLIQPLYAVSAKDGKFSLKEFLGDVSHAGLTECHPLLVDPPSKKRARKVIRRNDSIADTNRTEDRE